MSTANEPVPTMMLAFRWLVVACQAATLVITWPLWQVHTLPPMLPALPLPAIDLGLVLVATLLLVLVAPVPGIMAHTAALLYAVLIDQTRLQPEVISLAFLLWGTLPSRTAVAIARAHLVSLWLWAGVNKLLSPGFLHDTAQRLLASLVDQAPAWADANVGYAIALTELSVGVLALVPRTRRLAAWWALVVHIGILITLSPIGSDRNEAVWPWNVALAASGFALILPWRGSPLAGLRACHPVAWPAVAVLAVSPLGFYVGLTDAYLAHNLYSSNTASATVTCRDGCRPEQNLAATWTVFRVPMPPEHRLFEASFRQTCRRGDRLVITDTRWWFRRQHGDERWLPCPAGRRESAEPRDGDSGNQRDRPARDRDRRSPVDQPAGAVASPRPG